MPKLEAKRVRKMQVDVGKVISEMTAHAISIDASIISDEASNASTDEAFGVSDESSSEGGDDVTMAAYHPGNPEAFHEHMTSVEKCYSDLISYTDGTKAKDDVFASLQECL